MCVATLRAVTPEPHAGPAVAELERKGSAALDAIRRQNYLMLMQIADQRLRHSRRVLNGPRRRQETHGPDDLESVDDRGKLELTGKGNRLDAVAGGGGCRGGRRYVVNIPLCWRSVPRISTSSSNGGHADVLRSSSRSVLVRVPFGCYKRSRSLSFRLS
jgi:hypothetical protein